MRKLYFYPLDRQGTILQNKIGKVQNAYSIEIYFKKVHGTRDT